MQSQQTGSKALHEVDGGGIHGERPQAAVTCQPPVPGAAPVPHSSEGHLTEAAVQRVHIETNQSRERTAGAGAAWFCWSTDPCKKERKKERSL